MKKDKTTNKQNNDYVREEIIEFYSASVVLKNGSVASYHTYSEEDLLKWCTDKREQGLKPERQRVRIERTEKRIITRF